MFATGLLWDWGCAANRMGLDCSSIWPRAIRSLWSVARLERRSARHQVEERAQPIGAILLAQPALEPQAAVGAADARARRMDAAAGAVGSQVDAGRAPELSQLVHAEHRAAEGAAPALTLLRVVRHGLRTGSAS